MKASWFFPKSGGGERTGLNDGGMSNFRSPDSLGRETCQNIGDVRDDSGNPAIATFELVHIAADEFPGREQFIQNLESCRDYLLEGLPDGTGNEGAFFNTALELLNAESIPVLRIGDENTTGLIGDDDDRRKPFYRLLRQTGASSFQTVGGGTFGIGQKAPFAHSALRTIFYSTKTPEGSAFIAKSILASFPDPQDEELRQASGWWCDVKDTDKGDWATVRELERIPNRFRREEIGTDLWVSGFLSENWEYAVRHSILEHFFAAIANDQLVLRIMEDGEIITEISSKNLEEELIKAADEAKAIQTAAEYQNGLGATLYFYKALTNPLDGKCFEKEITRIGKAKLFVYRDKENNDIPCKWAKLRSPRIIVNHHGSGLLSNFAAVFICDNPDGNEYLAQLEDATHKKWSVDETRNWSEAQKTEGRKVLREIDEFVRETLKSIRGDDLADQEEIPFLGKYLPAEDDVSDGNLSQSNEPNMEHSDEESGERRSRQNAGKVTGKANPVEPPTVNTEIEQPAAGSSGGNDDDNPDPGPGPGPEPGPGPGPLEGDNSPGEGPDSPVRHLQAVSFRSFQKDDGYKLILRSSKTQSGALRLRAVGEDANFDLKLVSAIEQATQSSLPVSETTISDIHLVAGEPYELFIKVQDNYGLCLAVGE